MSLGDIEDVHTKCVRNKINALEEKALKMYLQNAFLILLCLEEFAKL